MLNIIVSARSVLYYYFYCHLKIFRSQPILLMLLRNESSGQRPCNRNAIDGTVRCAMAIKGFVHSVCCGAIYSLTMNVYKT